MKQSDQRLKGAIEGGGEQSGIEVVVSTCPVVCSLALIALSLYIYYAETKLTFSFVYQAEQIAEMTTAYFSHLSKWHNMFAYRFFSKMFDNMQFKRHRTSHDSIFAISIMFHSLQHAASQDCVHEVA